MTTLNSRIRRHRDISQEQLSTSVLVYLHIRCWGATSVMDVAKINPDLPTNIVTAMQSLLEDTSYIQNLWDYRDEAKRFLAKHSFPFYVAGLHYTSVSAVPKLVEGFQERHDRFFDMVEEFIENKDDLEAQFASKYPDLYRPDKYPTAHQLRSRFEFRWLFRHFSPPDKELCELPPEVYQEELRKFQKDMRTMRDTAISTIGQEFLNKIDTLKDQCYGGSPNSGTVKSIHAFFDRFDSLWDGFIGHAQLKSAIDEAKEYLEGVDAGMLKADDSFRDMVGAKMTSILDQIDAVKDVRLRRKLDV